MQSVAASAYTHMEDDADSPVSMRRLPPQTPEPQHYASCGRYSGCRPPHQTALQGVQLGPTYADEEESVLHAPPHWGVQHCRPQRLVNENDEDDDHDDRHGPRTPQTVCRLTTRLHPDMEYAQPTQPAPLHYTGADGSAEQQSPYSYFPRAADAPAMRRVRSLSCPSTDRSLAPARYSVGWGGGAAEAQPSLGRHTVLLTGGSYPAAAAAARPTVLLHTDFGVAASLHTHAQGRDGGAAVGASGLHDGGTRLFADTAHCGASSASVPRLTRMSLSSGGQSPAIQTNWSIGRPTALRCRYTEPHAHRDLGATIGAEHDGDEDHNDVEPWIGGATQVWRGSGEVHGPQRQEEEMVIAVPPSPSAGAFGHGRGHFMSSPPVVWRPAPVASLSASSQLDFSGCGPDTAVLLSGPPMAYTQDVDTNEGVDATQSDGGGVGATQQDEPLTDLEAAPRKSYARSTCATPPPTQEEAVCTVTHARPEQPVASAGGLAIIDSRVADAPLWAGVDACSCTNTSLYAGYGGGGSCAATPRDRGVRAAGRCQLTTGLAETLATDAVAAQLAHLSIHASPTQKRLAFEEEEEEPLDTGSDGGGAPVHIPLVCIAADGARRPAPRHHHAATTHTGGVSSAVALRDLSRGGRGDGRGGGSGFISSAVSRPMVLCDGRGVACRNQHAPSGLQLLRSRKRCLAEMQATDTGETTTPSLRSLGVMGASQVGAHARRGNEPCAVETTPCLGETRVPSCSGDSNSDELWKRRRCEELREHDAQLPFHAWSTHGGGGAEDLIAAPVRARPLGEAPIPESHAFHSGGGSDAVASWSEVSRISYVTPASQSTSVGLWTLPVHPSQGNRASAVQCSLGSESQVLTPLPTNVPPMSPSTRKP
ncbi:hypothetical protein NESM_000107300 [Novymonas esmeraldas]|uniref:Uncharacterized protein n=1 Tax=Novymonas esmeraldas TaxID=1808958 RepID=A0AAW0F5V0_9TRYP